MTDTERLDYIAEKMDEAWLTDSWKKLSFLMNSTPELYEYSFSEYYQDLPVELQRKTAIEAYTHRGDSVGIVREAVADLAGQPTYGLYELPADLAAQDTIKVYRAGSESIDSAAESLSWTIDPDVAQWFHERNTAWGIDSVLYTGLIHTADIIAYTDDRNEKEVIQHTSVYDIKRMRAE